MKLIDCISGFALLSMIVIVCVPALIQSNNAYLADIKKIRAVNDAYVVTNYFYEKSATEMENGMQMEAFRDGSDNFEIRDLKKLQNEKNKAYNTLSFFMNGKEFIAYSGGTN